MKGTEYKGLPVVPYDELEQQFPPHEFNMFHPDELQEDEPPSRPNDTKIACGRGYDLVSYVSSRATTFPGFEWRKQLLYPRGTTPFNPSSKLATTW
jgi:hypothetical protein